MTTIAYRGGVIAGDSQAVDDETQRKFYEGSKVFKHKGKIWGSCGSAVDCAMFNEWMRKGGPEPKLDCKKEFYALAWDGVQLWYYNQGFDKPEKIKNEFIAIGSGGAAAEGAMHMGATAVEAVRIAAKIDLYTGGKITSRKI